METDIYIRAVLSLAFVVGLIFGCLAIYKKFFMGKNSFGSKEKRMHLVETLYLDRQNRVVIIKKDDEEITILISPQGSSVIK